MSLLPWRRSREPWYADGVRFKCEGLECGDCCSGRWGSGYVWLNRAELLALAKHVGLSEADFVLRYTRRVEGGYSLIEHANGDCVFYADGKGCSVYEARPTQCRTYPFWPRVMDSQQTWEEEGERCPGINCGESACDLHSRKTIETQLGEQIAARRGVTRDRVSN